MTSTAATNSWERPPVGHAAAQAARIASALPVVTTERLRLRAPVLDDFPAYAAIMAADDQGWMGGPFDREAAFCGFCESVGRWLLRGSGLWAVERRADAVLVGFVALDMEWGDPELELGWMFLAAHHGNGYATEAARAARIYGFETLRSDSLVSFVAKGHARSAALAGRLGAVADITTYGADFAGGDLTVYRHAKPGGQL